VPDPLLSLDSITGSVGAIPLALVRSSTGGGADAAWVRVTGRLDVAAVPQLVRTLRQTQLSARLVVLDLRDLQLMDGSGVRVIVNASIEVVRRLVEL
jgi:anti-anti-sigma factor